jgi:hypothetical protein
VALLLDAVEAYPLRFEVAVHGAGDILESWTIVITSSTAAIISPEISVAIAFDTVDPILWALVHV